ncbi:MAG: HAD family phosphatase [Oscillospiraceae bacterium]|nr:HAD family phosphatase [Oscillospiraceae bacterium]
MKYDLIALDMDGTLCNDNKIIPKKNIEAIIEMQKTGKKVAVSTGRPESGILPFIKELQLDKFGGYVMSYNGGRIYDVKNKKILYNCPFPKEYLGEVFDIVGKSSMTVSTPIDGKIFAGNSLNEYSYAEAEIVKLPFEFTKDFLSLDIEMNKLLLIDNPKVVEKYFPVLKERLEPNLHVFLSEPYFIEITPPNINKGHGLHTLSHITGIPVAKMIAMGDSFNDVEMLKEAGLGVAMANSKEGVADYADLVTVSNNECGVAEIIRKYIL